mmetsp:Transcript_13940/g.46174  ORF Transcript_13940/g.46174 Transcript_13940/m.46174 type:complete len:259 (-) Transcript_13940:490-1266(-)
MLTSCARISISTRSERTPVVTPVKRLAFTGVPRVGCTVENHFGNRPSRAMTMYTLGWPIKLDTSAVVIAATAPKLMILSAQRMSLCRNAMAKGASTSMSVEGTMPVITALISAYSTATIPSDPMIPTGSALPGSFTSSAHVATVSKPTKEKNTTLAPVKTPPTPLGANGVQLSFSIFVLPATMTKPMTAKDTTVTTALNLAVSFMPCASKPVTLTTSKAAGKSSLMPIPVCSSISSPPPPPPIVTRSASGARWNSVAT